MAGETARQMVNAPKADKPEQPEPKARPNRFDSVFGAKVFKAASRAAKAYKNNDGSIGQKIATVMIAVLVTDGKGGTKETGAYVQGNVQAVKAAGSKKVRPVFRFLGTLQMGQAVKADDAGAQADLDSFCKKLANLDYPAWRKLHNADAIEDDDTEAATLDIELNAADDAA